MKEKSLNKKYVLQRMVPYLRKNTFLLIFAAGLLLSSNFLSLWVPRLAGKAIGAIGESVGNVNFELVIHHILIMAIYFIAAEVLNYILSIVMARASKNIMREIRKDLFGKIVTLKVNCLDDKSVGDFISAMTYDVELMGGSISDDILVLCKCGITIVFSMAMMLSIAPILVIVFAVTVPLSILATRFFTKKLKPLFTFRSISQGKLNGYSEEVIGGLKTIKAYNNEEIIQNEFSNINETTCYANARAEKVRGSMGPTINSINNLSYILTSLLGAILFLKGGIKLSDISSFVLYSKKFTGPISEIGEVWGDLQSALSAGKRVFAIIDEESEQEDEMCKFIEPIKGSVKFENVQFGYDNSNIILKNMNLDVNTGELIAIVGKTGAGKTTIINLLMRFYDITSGAIYIDGQNLLQVNKKEVRNSFGMVLQESWLFSGTILENLRYSNPEATMEDVEKVARETQIDKFINELKDGFDTRIDGNGGNISKGQKQLITIARALLKPCKMLILDEATSDVDTKTEKILQDAMRLLMKDKTCFVIAHRLSTIKNADRILVLDKGDIVESGTHSELMKKRGAYFELYNAGE